MFFNHNRIRLKSVTTTTTKKSGKITEYLKTEHIPRKSIGSNKKLQGVLANMQYFELN